MFAWNAAKTSPTEVSGRAVKNTKQALCQIHFMSRIFAKQGVREVKCLGRGRKICGVCASTAF